MSDRVQRLRLHYEVVGTSYNQVVARAHEQALAVLPEGTSVDGYWMDTIEARKYSHSDTVTAMVTIVYPPDPEF